VNVEVEWLGVVDYAETLDRQRGRREQILDGKASEVIWLLEHNPVLTTGRRVPENLPPYSFFKERGVDVYHTERGGLATYHGPGQLVCYVLIDRRKHRVRLRDVIRAMEETQIGWLATRGIQARRWLENPGVWVGDCKIGSVGLHERKGVTMHGFALNLCPDLTPFSWFVPCGVVGAGVTSVLDRTSVRVTPHQVAHELADRLLWTLLEFQY